MIKKIFKTILKLLIGFILLIAIAYGAFHLWEYTTGGKFVKYLEANSETVSLNESFTYDMAKADIVKSKVILVGEIHGTEEPSKFDVDFFKYLNQNFGVKHYFAEFDFVQAEYLNQFMVNKNKDLLREVLKNWFVIQGRNNQDYFNKYLYFQEYYEQLSENEKFHFIGIDKIQDWELTTKYLNGLISEGQNIEPIKYEKKGLLEKLMKQVDLLSTYYSNNVDTLSKIAHIKKNIEFSQNKTNREDVMFDNFNTLYTSKGLKNSKVYGFFGIFHVFQYRVNGKHPLASKIKQSDLGLENKMLSINFMMNDSYMVMASNKLPEFMRDKGAYTKMPISADNMLVMYIYGVKDFKRMTENNQKSLIKMNGENNPYSNSNRLNTTFQILPVTNLFKMTDKGKPYVQYTIFVRNSDWAEPMNK